MKRSVVALCLVLGLLGGAGMQAHGVAVAAGNSDAAHACQQGGYLTLHGTDGTTFKNEGQCVSYVARGGTIPGLSACAVTHTTGCLTFDKATLPVIQGGTAGDTIALTGATSFVTACSGQCFPLTPNDLATGGGIYAETNSGVLISSGIYRVANTTNSNEGLFLLDYMDGTGGGAASCSAATGARAVAIQVTLIDSTTQAQQTVIIGAEAGTLVQSIGLVLGVNGEEDFLGPVSSSTITC